MYRFQQHLKFLKQCIKILNKTIFVNIFQVQRLLEAQMELIQQQIISHGKSPYLALQEQTLSNQILERHN